MRFPQTYCPACAYPFTGHTEAKNSGAHPEPDDVSVCINCGALLEFGPDLSLRYLTPEKVIELDGETLLFVIRTALQIKRQRHQERQ